MAKPAGKTLGGRGSDHDRRFDVGVPIAGAYCDRCFKACLPHESGLCRSCRPKRAAPVQAVDDKVAIEELAALKIIESARNPKADPEDIPAALAEIEAAKKIERDNREGGGKAYHRRAIQGDQELDKATKKALAKARAIERAERAEPVIETCTRIGCGTVFTRRSLLQEYCSKECQVAVEKLRFKVGKAQKETTTMPIAEKEASADELEPGVPGLREPAPNPSDREDEPEVLGEASSSREDVARIEEIEDHAPEPVEQPRAEEPLVEEQTMTAEAEPVVAATYNGTRFTVEQLQHADVQNRPPHWRSHADIAKEMGTSQAHLSRILARYREEHGLDAPDLQKHRAALRALQAKKATKLEKPKKIALKNVTIEQPVEQPRKKKRDYPATCKKCQGKFPKNKVRWVDGVALCTDCRQKPHASSEKPTPPRADLVKKGFVAVPVDLLAGSADTAYNEVLLHRGSCKMCSAAQLMDEMCFLGRTFVTRWGRLEARAAESLKIS